MGRAPGVLPKARAARPLREGWRDFIAGFIEVFSRRRGDPRPLFSLRGRCASSRRAVRRSMFDHAGEQALCLC